MAGDQKSKFPEKISDMEDMKGLSSPDVLDQDSGQGSIVPQDQGDNIEQAGTVPTVSSDALLETPTDDDDGRIDISSGEDVDVEPDEEEQSDEPAQPVIPPDRIE
jgi:hypothetical protein